MLNADSDAASEIPRRWRIPADLHGAGQLFSRPGVRPAVTRHGGHANNAEALGLGMRRLGRHLYLERRQGS